MIQTEQCDPRLADIAHGIDGEALDLDILFYDDYAINSEELTIPHPRFSERRFVLEPLAEVAGEHCPSHWRDRLPQYGVYPRGPIDSLVAHVTTS